MVLQNVLECCIASYLGKSTDKHEVIGIQVFSAKLNLFLANVMMSDLKFSYFI